VQKAANTKKMLKQWNTGLAALKAAVQHPDRVVPLVPYAEAFSDSDKVNIPSADLPPGIPAWMYDNDGWAARKGATALEKRKNITITVPPEGL
jgi:uracil-DNA glycosylase